MANEKRLIDAKALERQIKLAFEDTNPYVMGQMLRWIRKQTKVDAVEVVRCKDCKRWGVYPDLEDGMCHCLCRCTGKDDFCSYGERKDKDA